MKLRTTRTSTTPALKAVAALFTLALGCSALLDHSAAQCATDTDCSQFPGHPYCEAGLCVASGLGPSACYFGTPTTPAEFENQCGAAQCFAFDDCSRLGDCDGGLADAALVAPTRPDSGAPTISMSDDGAVPAAPAYPNCVEPDAGRGQVVIITGSSNFPTTLGLVAPLVIDAGYVPIFQTTSSCAGVASVFSTDVAGQTLTDPAPGSGGKYAQYYNADGSAVSCLLGPSGAHVDIGESDVFSETCGAGSPAAGVGEWLGPIQAMVFAVPGSSNETAISAEAARAVFGIGGARGRVPPWTNPAYYFVRSASTGTQQMIGHAIGVPATAFWGVTEPTASAVAGAISGADVANVENVIGILSVDVYDQQRTNLKALAFRGGAQDCAYLPDSTLFATDKQNVRDGHYPIWGPIHFFAASTGASPATPQAQAFIEAVAPPKLSEDLVAALIASSLVPDCAMTVTRATELGPLSSYSPPNGCTCFFLSQVDTGVHASCDRCTRNEDCPDPARPACNYGFCEPQ